MLGECGTKNTLSNVDEQSLISDTGGHEANRPSQREDDRSRLSTLAKGSGKAMAGRRNYKFRDRAGTVQDCGSRDSQG